MAETSTPVKRQDTFRCRICNLDKPEDQKARPWKKGNPGTKGYREIDLGRCIACARQAAAWNSALKRDGVQVVKITRTRRKGRRQ